MIVVERLGEAAVTQDLSWQGDILPLPSVVEGYDGVRFVLAQLSSPLSPAMVARAKSLGATHMACPEGGWFSVLTAGPVPATHRISLPSHGMVEGLDLQVAWEAFEPPQTTRDLFVNVHTHTDSSPLDGLTMVPELIATTAGLGQETVVATDHGHCAAHPDLLKQAAAADMQAIPGLEAYWVPDRHARGPDSPKYNHLTIWALTQRGLTNLWAWSSEAHRTGFYGHPRGDWELMERYSEGLAISTACLRGPLADFLANDDVDSTVAWLSRARRIFENRLWVEIHTNQLPAQIALNHKLVEVARWASLPLIAAVDSHYPTPADKDTHRLWLTAQTHGGTKKSTDDKADDSGLFQGHQDYHLAGSAEVRSKLSYLPSDAVEEAIAQTVAMAAMSHVETPTKVVAPMFDPQRGRAYATERLRAICEANWDRRVKGKSAPELVYREKFEFEMDLLGRKHFHDYFMVVADYVRYAKSQGILLGPGRGSGSASLVAYLADIIEVDPVEYDLYFGRFMTEGRVDPPDFDVDFPTSKAKVMQDYVTERWGVKNVVRVGSVLRMRNRKAVKAARQMLVDSGADIPFMEIENVCSIIEDEEADSAGLGKSWDEVMTNAEEALSPYRSRYPQVFHLAERIVGRISAFGKHASGMVISTSEDGSSLLERLPMRRGSDEDDESTAESMVTEFDYRVLEEWGFLKADFLFLRTLDTLQFCSDLITQRRGFKITPYDWIDEFADPQVWDAMCAGQTLGCFQVETPSMTRLIKQFRPRSINDLADVITLVRPGPTRSGLTDTYLKRRFGEEATSYLDPRLETILAPTRGCMIYQEQVMQICRDLAGYDDVKADAVRKILGKKLRDKVEAAGRDFNESAVAHGTDPATADIIWKQMVSFSMYSFNRAHAISYAILAFYTQWYRVHWPEEFFTAVLSTLSSASAKQRVPEFVNEVRRIGFSVKPPDINLSAKGFTAGEMSVRYGFGQIKGIGDAAVGPIIANQPYDSVQGFRDAMKGTAVNSGHIKTLAAVGAFDSIEPNRRALERFLAAEADGSTAVCVDRTLQLNEHGLPCRYDWDNEPVELTAKGKPKVRKIPAKCTKACRNYRAAGFATEGIEPYTPGQVRDREMEMLGVWLSSTPFDRIPDDMWSEMIDAEQIENSLPGVYYMPGVMTRCKTHRDSAGRQMAFLTVLVKSEEVDVVAFSDAWKVCGPQIQMNKLGIYEVLLQGRGVQLRSFSPVPD